MAMNLSITRGIGAAFGARGTTRLVLWAAGAWLALLLVRGAWHQD